MANYVSSGTPDKTNIKGILNALNISMNSAQNNSKKSTSKN